jgi:hypothetical protein
MSASRPNLDEYLDVMRIPRPGYEPLMIRIASSPAISNDTGNRAVRAKISTAAAPTGLCPATTATPTIVETFAS